MDRHVYIGTGDVASIGSGPGQFFTVNVPLKDGLTDNTFHRVFTRYIIILIHTCIVLLAHNNIIIHCTCSCIHISSQSCV